VKNAKGFHRVTWDFTKSSKQPIDQSKQSRRKEVLVPPGEYKAVLIQNYKGQQDIISDTISFVTKRLYQPSLKGKGLNAAADFWKKLDILLADARLFRKHLETDKKLVKLLEKAYFKTDQLHPEILKQIYEVRQDLVSLDRAINGSPSKDIVGEKNIPRISDRIRTLIMGTNMSSYGPTGTHLKTYEIIKEELREHQQKLQPINEQIKGVYKELLKLKAPVIPEMECLK
jgi:5-bromo-4-chloroindolyl phosphate hydrolysis protein